MGRNKGAETMSIRVYKDDWRWLAVNGRWSSAAALEQLVAWARSQGYDATVMHAHQRRPGDDETI